MKISTREIMMVGLFAALTAVGAFISIPIGPVPITLQGLFVLLSGFVLGAKLGALSQIVYVLLGLIGLPIFAGFTGGIQTVMKPSFGFLLAFIVAAFLAGLISEKLNGRFRFLISGFIASCSLYLIGIPYMGFILNSILGKGFGIETLLKIGMISFIPGDISKLIVASLVADKLQRTVGIRPVINK